MKSIILTQLLIFLLTGKVRADLPAEIEENFRALFELWKSGEIHGKVPFELPPIEPFPLPPFCQTINKLGVKSHVETGPIQVYGLKEMTLDKMQVSDTGHDIGLELSTPKLRLHSDTYTLKGKAMYVYNVKGAGTFDMTLFNVRGSGKFHLKSEGTGTEIDQLAISVKCEKAEGNLQDASWPINNIINTKGKLLVDAFQTEINDIGKIEVQRIFREPLSKIKFEEILQYMKDILSDSLEKANRRYLIEDDKFGGSVVQKLLNNSVFLREAY